MHLSFTNNNNFVVKADSVIYENKYGRLEVFPSTSRGLILQRQWANLTWCYPDNTLSVAFSFNDSLSYGRIFRWNGTHYNPVNTNHVEYSGKHYYLPPDFNVVQNVSQLFYWEYSIPMGSSGKWDLYAKLASDSWATAHSTQRLIHLDPWWNSSTFFHRVDYKISSDYISTTLTNFPVLVNISSSIAAKCDGGDSIRFVDSTNTSEFGYEIEQWDAVNDRYFVWVNVTSVSNSVSTYFNMYYNNSNVNSYSRPWAVWDSDYIVVHHMSNLSDELQDSTSNNYHSVDWGTPIFRHVESNNKGYCVKLEGNEFFVMDNNIFDDSTSITVESYVKFDVYDGDYRYIFDLLDDLRLQTYYHDTNDAIQFVTYDGSYHYLDIESNPSNTDDFQHFITIWGNEASVYWKGVYLDGVLVNSINNEDTQTTDSGHNIIGAGGIGNGDDSLVGKIDEMRFSKSNRSASYCVASFHTINETIGFMTCSVEDTFSGDILEPSSFWANTSSASQINLEWIIGTNITHTYIERYTSASWSRGTGTMIYNNTGTSYSDTGRTGGIIYYYQAWGYNSTLNNFSNAYIATNNFTSPNNPTDAIGILVTETSLNISWTLGTVGVDNTAVIRKSGSYPTGPTDGTEIYNSTGTYYVDTGFATGMYYRLYSYNSMLNRFSTGVNAPYGSLSINVYDENTSEAITYWDIFISNADGSQTYENLSNNNTLVIDTADLPTGDDVNIIINASWYDSKLFVMDIAVDTAYILDAYLSETNATNLYVFYVQNEYDDPIDDATVRIRRYIDDSVGYQNVSLLKTDANGMCNVFLVPSVIYHIEISKSGYVTEVDSDFRPDPNQYGIYYPIIYQLQFERGEPDILIPSDIIHFNATINNTGVITVWYVDSNSRTTNTQIRIYQYYNKTLTWNYTDSRTGDNSFSFTDTGYNISMMHKLVLYLNHTDLGFVILTFFIEPIRTLTLPSTIEGYWDDVFGDFELGWVNTIFLFMPCMFFLIVFGGHHAGLGILSSGMYLGFTTYFLNLSNADVLLTVASLLSIVGFFLIILKKGRDAI